MDEVPVQFDYIPKKTMDVKGKKQIVVTDTGNTKNRFTVTFLYAADGSKYKPFIIFKGAYGKLSQKKKLERNLLKQVLTFMSVSKKNGWLDSSIMINEWLGDYYNQEFTTSGKFISSHADNINFSLTNFH